MSSTIYFDLGKPLTKNDLNIFIYDTDGITLINPFAITYTIYQVVTDTFVSQLPTSTTNPSNDCDEQAILETIDSVPVPFGIGMFFAAWQMAIDITIGNYKIKWRVRKFTDTPAIEAVEEFKILNQSSLTYSDLNGTIPGSVPLPADKFGNLNLWAG